jgi:hypothetical protein
MDEDNMAEARRRTCTSTETESNLGTTREKRAKTRAIATQQKTASNNVDPPNTGENNYIELTKETNIQPNYEPIDHQRTEEKENKGTANGNKDDSTTILFLPNRVNNTLVSTKDNNQNSTSTVSSTLPSKQSEAFSYLEEDDCHREREVVIGYKLVDKLTEYQESLLSYAWISDNFHKAKYLND